MSSFLKKIDLVFRFKNPFYNFILGNKATSQIVFIPENIWTGNSENGRKIIDGFLSFHNESISFDNDSLKKNKGSKLWNQKLHSMQWINDVRAVGTNKARVFLRKKIKNWINFHNTWDPFIWNTRTLSQRLCYFMENTSFFFKTADESFQKTFAKSINKQAIHLINHFNKDNQEIDRIFIPKAIIISSLCFENLRNKLDIGINLLEKTIQKELLDDGMHFSRSPTTHFFFLRSLIDIKNHLGLSELPIPQLLNEKISKMGSVLKFLKINNDELVIFNEFNYVSPEQLSEVLKRSNIKMRIPKNLEDACFRRVSENRLTFIMDCGKPLIKNTHAGALSFEFSYFGEKLVVNSGSPYVDDKKWIEAMRSTAAHSTANVDDINSSDIFSYKDNTTRIANVWSEELVDKNYYWINSAHSGYKQLFGIVHNRKIHIDTEKLIIRGQDYFSKPLRHKDEVPKKVFIRFHIHPDVRLNVTTSKKKVFLKLKNNIAWEFICSEPKISIKEGIYLGTEKTIQKNNHIEISDNFIPEKKIKWVFKLIR